MAQILLRLRVRLVENGIRRYFAVLLFHAVASTGLYVIIGIIQSPSTRKPGLLFGPVFAREVAIAPRRARMYVARGAYAGALLLLISTAWLVLTGTQVVRDVSDLAQFAGLVFQILAPLQLALAVFFSAMLAASAVAQEKDRKTFVLLLLSRLTNQELVLGKLLASLLNVLVMFAAGLPIFVLLSLLGGISAAQIARTAAVTVASIIVCGSLGSTLAQWREKTFQALALFVLALVLWLALGEAIAAGALGRAPAGIEAHRLAVAVSPWQAVLEAARPFAAPSRGGIASPIVWFLLVAAAATVLLNGLAIARVRVWNTTTADERVRKAEDVEQVGETKADTTKADGTRSVPATLGRAVWDNPILWRKSAPGPMGAKSSLSASRSWRCSRWWPPACGDWSIVPTA